MWNEKGFHWLSFPSVQHICFKGIKHFDRIISYCPNATALEFETITRDLYLRDDLKCDHVVTSLTINGSDFAFDDNVRDRSTLLFAHQRAASSQHIFIREFPHANLHHLYINHLRVPYQSAFNRVWCSYRVHQLRSINIGLEHFPQHPLLVLELLRYCQQLVSFTIRDSRPFVANQNNVDSISRMLDAG